MICTGCEQIIKFEARLTLSIKEMFANLYEKNYRSLESIKSGRK